MTEASKELYFYDDWLAQHTKGKLLCGNNRYLHENHVDALEAQASAEGFDRGVKEAQPIVESLRAELHSLYDAIGFDPLDLENGHDNARAAIDALLKAEREKALREAEKNLSVYAPSLVDGPEHDVGYYHGYVTALHRVLDLIAEDKTDE